ncbi:putative endo-beta-1,4-glucanase D [Amylocarpus encephaloides]|uniref:AA9 family lytic polysaccharide monooxygenase n=1 Tax=Amylocarpus encephaloides TaxID=45428 RepID=A0A9P7YNT8_9HELO|nr:putative endo-beta-1,4-glucanase D [Amylocarpus encephaloides]
MKFQSGFHVSALLGVASSHTIFTQLTANGVTNGIGVGIRIPSYDGPITNVASNDIACNGGPNPTTPSSKIIDVQAGSTVKARWRHTQQSGPNDIIDAGHSGPVMAYLKKVSNAATDPGYGSGWFKISEAGLMDAASKRWAVNDLIKALGEQSIEIPSCIASGQYLLRAEIIALHGARSNAGAQFYMECAQINITGGSGSKTPATVSLPGAYKANDPGVLVNIYTTPTISQYKIPGPPVFKC